MSILVPNNETFSLINVLAAIQWHSPAATGDLASCFSNAVSNFFDPDYNKDDYAPANSMKRFRNYGSKSSAFITSSTTWTAPAGVTKIVAYLWGGGGAGGGGGYEDYQGGGGGGGGGFHSGLGPVTAGNGYVMTVAASVDGSAWYDGPDGNYTRANFNNSEYVQAGGGGGGKSYTNGGSGGLGTGGNRTGGVTFIAEFVGGRGADGTGGYSGGGGGGAGSLENGNGGSDVAGGAGGSNGGGAGGNGRISAEANGYTGNIYGGGGGGATKLATPGTGAQGAIYIYY